MRTCPQLPLRHIARRVARFGLAGLLLASVSSVALAATASPDRYVEDNDSWWAARAAAFFFGYHGTLLAAESTPYGLAEPTPDAITADRAWANTGTDYNNGASWGGTAPGSGDRGVFSTAAVTQPNLSASVTNQGIAFSTTTASGYNLTSSSTAIKLTLTNTGTSATAAAIYAANTGGTNIIAAPIVMGAAALSTQTIHQASGGTLTISGVISSTSSITLSLQSTGTFNLNGANTYTGTTSWVNSGSTTGIGNAAAFGTSTINMIGSTFRANADLTGANKLTNSISLAGSPTFSNSGTFGLEFGGPVDLGAFAGNRTITSQISGGLTFSGAITNGAGTNLIFSTLNASVVTLSGTNTYTGNTTISGTGKLSVSVIGNSGANGNLGAGTTVNIGSGANAGTLLYTGLGETTTKVVNLNGSTGGATIDQSGTSGVLTFSSNLTATGLGIKTLTLQGSTSGAGEFSGAIVDNSSTNKTSLVKAGTGTWTLSGANTYTGTTAVNGGTLLVNGGTVEAGTSGTGSGNVTVTGSGSTLGGIGRISGTVTLGGATPGAVLNPGANGVAGTESSVGTLRTGALTLTGANTVRIDAFGTAANQWDQLISSGAILLGSTSTLQLSIASGLTFTPNTTYTLLSGTSLGGTFSGIMDGQTYNFSGYEFTANYTSDSLNLVAVPEPSTWAAGILSVLAVGFTQRKRFKRHPTKAAA